MVNNNAIKMRDLSIPKKDFGNYIKIIKRVMTHGNFILGPENQSFEDTLKNICKSNYAIGVSSCSAALYLSLKCLNLSKGDEIITTPMSWLVSSSAIVLAGGTPVFVDVDDDYNLDPNQLDEAYNHRTKAVLVVHFYGKIAQIELIHKFVKKNNIKLIEDCAQSFGTKYNNKVCGTFGDFGCYSFSPMKIIPSFGDAGAVVVNDKQYEQTLRSLKHCGTIDDLETAIYSELKHNLDPIHAAIANFNLLRCDELLKERRKIANIYLEELSDLNNNGLILPKYNDEESHAWYDFTIRTRFRSKLMDYLKKYDIPTRIRHPVLISDQPGIPGKIIGELKNAKKFVKQITCLPIYNSMPLNNARIVSEKIRSFFNS